jgi:hypothetical protein
MLIAVMHFRFRPVSFGPDRQLFAQSLAVVHSGGTIMLAVVLRSEHLCHPTVAFSPWDATAPLINEGF